MMPYHPNFKDTRWLTLEVCREFQRNKCNRTENECKFAHPQPHVEVLNGKVIACYDSLKGKCSRREPPCKYLHPPQHLKDQLLQNGKNNLVLKQVALAMMHQQHHQQQVPQQAAQHHQNAMLAAASPTQFHTSYHGAPGASALYNQMANGSIQPLIQVTSANGQQTLVPLMTNGFHPSGLSLQSHANAIYATDPTTLIQHVQAPNLASQNTILPHQRTDRLTVCREHQKGTCSKSANECSQAHPPAYCPVDADSQLVTVCVDFIKGKCSRDTCKYFHPPEHLVAQLKKQKMSNNAAVALANSPSSYLTTANFGMMPHINTSSHHHINSPGHPSHFRVNNLQGTNQATMLNASNSHMGHFKLLNSLQYAQYAATNATGVTQFLAAGQTSPMSIASASANTGASLHNIDDQLNGTAYAIDNNAAYQIPHGYQLISAPAIYSTRQQNANAAQANGHASNASQNQVSSSIDENQGSNDGSNQGNIYGSHLPIKRAALIDNKTGMPVYQPYHSQYANLAQQQAIAAYQANGAAYAMQYAQYPPGAYSLQYNGHPTGVPRL